MTRPSSSRSVFCSALLSTPNTLWCAAIASLTTASATLRPSIGQERLKDPSVLRILLALHQSAALELLQRQLHALGADQQPAREIGTGQPGLGGELAQHADLRGADAVLAHRVVHVVNAKYQACLSSQRMLSVCSMSTSRLPS